MRSFRTDDSAYDDSAYVGVEHRIFGRSPRRLECSCGIRAFPRHFAPCTRGHRAERVTDAARGRPGICRVGLFRSATGNGTPSKVDHVPVTARGSQRIGVWPWQMRKARRNPPPFPNPIQIPVTDREFVWNAIVETITDYFGLPEERVRQVGNVLTQGRIDAHPLTGATIAEPWRQDSTHGFEKWHSTFQSVRRQAEVRVHSDQRRVSGAGDCPQRTRRP